MLEKVDKINDLSDGLRAYLQKEWDKLPDRIVYKFNIHHDNPDPEKYNGPILWPSVFKLPQVRFSMVDPFSEPKRQIHVGMVKEVDDKGVPNRFDKIAVKGSERGVVVLRKASFEDQNRFAYMELHPRHGGNKWRDKEQLPIFHRVDEEKEAGQKRATRAVRITAMSVAESLKDYEVKNFAAALNWDENEPMTLLRDKLETLAEDDAQFFTDLFNTGNLEYRYTVKRAVVNHIIAYVPTESKFIWVTNQQTIATLPFEEAAGKDEVQRMGEWMATSGKVGEEVYKKLKVLLGARK